MLFKYIIAFSIVSFLFFSSAATADTDSVCNREFAITKVDGTLYQRFCGNVNMTTPNANIQEFHIYIHGTGLTSQHYTMDLIPAAIAAGKGNRIAIVAPQFIRSYTQGLPIVNEFDVAVGGTLDLNGADADNLYYGAGWIEGDLSFTGSQEAWAVRAFRISSFEVLDIMLAKAKEIYPNINRIVVTGHSAGGQMIERYTYAATIPAAFPERNVLFAPVNPSSSLYFDALRPDSPVDFPITFSTPADTLCDGLVLSGGVVDPEEFIGYNEYKYAMMDADVNSQCDGCNSFMSAIPFTTLIRNYTERQVLRMISLDDNDPNEESIAQTCPNHLQGDHRLARSEAYMQHIINELGERKWVISYDSLYAPNCAHSGICVWLSDCGKYVLFGQNAGTCADRNEFFSSFDNDLSGWTKTGTGGFSRTTHRRAKGAGAANLQGIMTNMVITSDQIVSTGVHTISWAGWVSSPMDTADTVIVELSVDGGSWTEIGRFQGNQMAENVWNFQEFSASSVTSLQLRFVCNASQADEYVIVDEVKVMKRQGLN